MNERNDIRQKPWETEASFFDELAARGTDEIKQVDPMAVARYSAPRLRRRFCREFQFRLLGNLSGKSVLDVGCGEGGDSVLLAKLGGRVTGVDVSPGAIEVAEKRAMASRVSDSTRFYCTPIESCTLETGTFDVIWCHAIFHHLIPSLHPVMQKLIDLAAPNALMVINEPINLNRTLRRIRQWVPIHTEATPDERPLEIAELHVLREYIPDMVMRCYYLFGRLDRFILTNSNYERSSSLRRFLSSTIAAVDYGLLRLPVARNLGGQALMYGHPLAPK